MGNYINLVYQVATPVLVLLILDKQKNTQTINEVGVGLATKELEKQRPTHRLDSGNMLKETNFSVEL